MRRRLGIAAALLRNPRLLLLEAWHGFLRVPADWTPVVRAIWVCALYTGLPLAAAYFAFLRRDVASE